MLHFDSDYMEGAHPELMRRLMETNLEQTSGYGTDEYTERARQRILETCGLKQGKVFFLVGGTQTNATVIDGLLAHHEGVLAADTGHISVHESGAIEASGHKVLTLPSYDGKVRAEDVKGYITDFYRDDSYEHMVAPGMLYISHPTELGTLYSLAELEALSTVCREADIPLYMDGARLGYADGRRYGCDLGGCGSSVRCLLYRWNESRYALWRSCCRDTDGSATSLLPACQAARCLVGQRQTVGHTV